MLRFFFSALLALPVLVHPLAAYTCNKATLEPLSVEIVKPAVMAELDSPLAITTVLKNASETPLAVTLSYSTIETIVFEGGDPLAQDTLTRKETVPAKGEITVAVNVVGTPGTLAAHYPVHLNVEFERDGATRRVAVVQPFESTITPNPNWPAVNPMLGKSVGNLAELPVNTLPAGGGLPLASLTTYWPYWTWDKETGQGGTPPPDTTPPIHFLPIGWTGSDATSGASVTRHPFERGGLVRQSIQMHPAYRGGAGTVAAGYRIQLPETGPITFTAFGAMRDLGPNEPASDGVVFQVLVAERVLERDLTPPTSNPVYVGKVVLGKHITSQTWEPVEVDLSAFAGREILLWLVADPGPKRDTTCDSCFWGDPTLFTGEKPPFADPEPRIRQQAELLEECVAAMKNGKSATERTRVLTLEDGQFAVLTFGEYGFLDGKIAVGSPEAFVVYDGVQVAVKDAPLGAWPTVLAAGPWIPKTADTKAGPPKPTKKPSQTNFPLSHPPSFLYPAQEWAQEIAIGGERATMYYSLRANGPALQLSVDCSEPAWISRVQLGAANQPADAVYYGHGYRVVPGEKPFSVGAGGHGLSTSHVGMQYADLAVLLATTTTPDRFTVDGKRNIATLVVHPGTTFTLLPRPLAQPVGLGDTGGMGNSGGAGNSGQPDAMFDCAVRYRTLNPLKAAPGVPSKLGRFCFDIWGGSYKRHTEIVENAARYGLTDSLFVNHVWQRHGYDNRLPDIWPPNERFGTPAEMRETLRRCDEAGILYGLHDNYIDFYPDADGFNFDSISFEADGRPRKAWINEGINARSYQFRPDRFAPFLKRNLDLMLPELPQSCYFVDVFASMPPFDFYDREGRFHSRAETLQHWNRCFDTIRERLTTVRVGKRGKGENPANFRTDSRFHAPTISEAGQDFLIGHLDGADCQFTFLSDQPGEHLTHLPCKDWERIPWFDAVNHTNFSLHGVGYSNRYEAGRGRTLHGIESDDYITAEILTGHAAMVDLGSALRGAVRKYWLLQPTLRELAACELARVEYDGGDMHRQKITWKSADGRRVTSVYVNRGQTDWEIAHTSPGSEPPVIRITLPPFGFYVTGPAGFAGIFRTENGDIAEFAREERCVVPTNADGADDPDAPVAWKDRFYLNARRQIVEGLLPIRPALKPGSFTHLGGNRFTCEVLWDAKAAAPLDYAIFVHLVPDGEGNGRERGKIVGNYGCEQSKPTTAWSGEITTPLHPAVVADGVPAGKYRLLVGLYHAKGDGHRAHLLGTDNDTRRYRLGTVKIVRNADGAITDISMEPEPLKEDFEAELQKRLLPPSEPLECAIPLSWGPLSGGGGHMTFHLKTDGAFLCDAPAGRLRLTPLPNEPAAEVEVRHGGTKVYAEDADGVKIRDVPATSEGDRLRFTTQPGEFRYVIE